MMQNPFPVHMVGLGMSPADLTQAVRELIDQAQVLVGGRRLLGYFPDHPAERIVLGKEPDKTLQRLPELAATRRVVVLASGDPNFYGIGPLVVGIVGAANVVIHPNVTAVQAACARMKLSWHDATLVSLHGRNWEGLAAALPRARKIILYTDPEHSPAAIARYLLDRGLSAARLGVLEDLGQPGERVGWHSLSEASRREYSPLNTVILIHAGIPDLPPLHLGLPETAFAHEAGLITKTEVRAVVLAKLQLLPGQTLWDVGAGSGSVGLEASLFLTGGSIYAVEKNQLRAAQIEVNRAKFGVANLEIICAQAPDGLASLPDPDRVFIGGGGTALKSILTEVVRRLKRAGRLVVSAVRLETLETARAVLAQASWECEITQLQVSRSQPLAGDGILAALNPVWLVSGWKK
jgi:precorrin-6Y C5,15-methyltransferase (decarboxylating)